MTRLRVNLLIVIAMITKVNKQVICQITADGRFDPLMTGGNTYKFKREA